MRKSIALATFLAVGVGAISVNASRTTLVGSDTLKEITVSLLTNATCGTASLAYIGTGSGNGESALLASVPTDQQGAPMSRALANSVAVCTKPADGAIPGGATRDRFEGIVFALDGLSIVGSISHAGTAACTGTVIDCDPGDPSGTVGIAMDTLIPGTAYTLNNWRDALRVLYTGFTHDGIRNCNSDVRQKLVSSWSNMFEQATCDAAGECVSTGAVVRTSPGRACPPGSPDGNSDGAADTTAVGSGRMTSDVALPPVVAATAPLAPSSNCGTGVAIPNGLQHAYRRNDESGTTDVFITLLKFPGGVTSPPGGSDVPSINLGAGSGFGVEPLGVSPFCNVHPVPAATPAPIKDPILPIPVTGATVQNPRWNNPPCGSAADYAAGCTATRLTSTVRNPWFNSSQDWDPIRRTCTGVILSQNKDDVCEARGDLGIVLPIWDAPSTDGVVTPGAFRQNRDCNSKNGVNVFSQITANGVPAGGICGDGRPRNVAGQCTECPNGGAPISFGSRCVAPADAPIDGSRNPNVDCINGRDKTPNLAGNNALVDGRVWGLWAFQPTTPVGIAADHVNTVHGSSNGVTLTVPMNAAFYRIHEGHSQAGSTCHSGSATDQIGCLVGSNVDPCSLGYAGREGAVANAANTISVKVHEIDPEPACVRQLLTNPDPDANVHLYPIARKLYFNTSRGFENVTGDDLLLAQCFGRPATAYGPGGGGLPGAGTPGDSAAAVATNLGFISLDSAVGVKPFCEDFNETLCAGAPVNVDACADSPNGANPAGIPPHN